MKKYLLPFLLILFILAVLFQFGCLQKDPPQAVNGNADENSYQIVYEDELKTMSFDAASPQKIENECTGETYINVWVKNEHKTELPSGGIDVMLWHLDIHEKQYKVSDSYAYNLTDGQIVEE